jgi:hypothetical protein
MDVKKSTTQLQMGMPTVMALEAAHSHKGLWMIQKIDLFVEE